MASPHNHGRDKFKELLRSTLVSSVEKPKELVIIPSTLSVYEGFTKIVGHNILSAPVYDVKEKKYTGFLDVRDLVSFVVFIDDDQHSQAPNDLEQILKHGLKVFKVPVDGVTCTYLSRRNPFHAVKATDNLLTVAEMLSKGMHRVAVLNDAGDVTNIISQSSLVHLFHKHRKELAPNNTAKLSELTIGTAPVLSVKASTKAIEVFRLMDNKKLTGVAVVDESGRLVGNTSASDLKLFLKLPSMVILDLPISQFLQKIRLDQLETRSPIMSVSSHHTLDFYIEKLTSTQVHRLFVAEDHNNFLPERVISVSDLLKYIVA